MTKHKTPMIMVYFRGILIVTISIDIMMRPHISIALKIVFIIGVMLLHLNDHWRNRYQLFEKNRIIYYISMTISIVGTGLYLIQFDNCKRWIKNVIKLK
ncbi:hypothetical protein [Bacillus salipaludis]|uniref:DUF4181 domain-containing protein n=1 Tax=Bacillus salipaludis TaxID=2547811 RepID=A0ABW8RKC0_9BACI